MYCFPSISTFLHQCSILLNNFPLLVLKLVHRLLFGVLNWEIKMSSIAAGPWGGQSGYRWDDGVYSTVRQIVITFGAGIDSIQFEYDKNGQSIWSDKHGGTGGIKMYEIKLQHPTEFLISFSGHCGPLREGGPVIVRSLRFQSNRRKYGPFGIEQGMPFSLPISGDKLVGFHGRSSWYLDAIGVYAMQKNPALTHRPVSYGLDGQNKLLSDTITGYLVGEHKPQLPWGVPNVPREPALYDIGPWGGEGGQPWDDGVYTGVRQICLTRSGEAICSIQIEYDRNGQSVWAPQHGRGNEACTYLIKLSHPSEFLTCISGYCDAQYYGDRRKMVVRSLSFLTNRAKYGPFGKEIGTHFSSAKTEGKVIGFHGRSGQFLDALGVHMQRWLADEVSSRPGHLSEREVIRNMLHRFMH